MRHVNNPKRKKGHVGRTNARKRHAKVLPEKRQRISTMQRLNRRRRWH